MPSPFKTKKKDRRRWRKAATKLESVVPEWGSKNPAVADSLKRIAQDLPEDRWIKARQAHGTDFKLTHYP